MTFFSNHRPRPGPVLATLPSLFALIACGEVAPGEVATDLPRVVGCAAGERTLPDGSCQPAGLPPDMPCAPGERALAGGGCQPAGVPPEACAPGRFVPDGRGGCAAILPEAPCSPGAMAVPGDRGCREVSPCGAGRWDDAIPRDEPVEYVDRGYAGDGSDGSRERPWTTVQAGVDAAASAGIVAVAEGRYEEDVVIARKPVRLWGLCPAKTVIAGVGEQSGAVTVASRAASGTEVRGLAATGPSSGVAVVGARSVVLEKVWVHDAAYVGVAVVNDATVVVRGALLENNQQVGALVQGAQAAFQATAVRASRPNAAEQLGYGIMAQQSVEARDVGHLAVTSSLIEGNRGIGVDVAGAEATIEATVIRATEPAGPGEVGIGVVAEPDRRTRKGGKLSLTATLVEGNRAIGVEIAGAEATIEATVIRATQPDSAGEGGIGVLVEPGPASATPGRLSLTASLLDDNREIGVVIDGSQATIESTVVRATQPNGAGVLGRGISVQADTLTGARAMLALSASRIEGNHDEGVFVGGSDATIDTTVVRATEPDADGRRGRGITVGVDGAMRERGRLSLSASLVEENRSAGVLVLGADAAIEATVIRATQLDGSREFGTGVAVQTDVSMSERGKLSLTSVLIESNHQGGVFVGGSDATVDATVVRTTEPDGRGRFGRGIAVQADASMRERGTLSLTGSLIEDNHDAGVFLTGSDATIDHTVVRRTRRAAAGLEAGDGILVLDTLAQSSATIVASESTDNARVGILYMGSTGDVSFVRSSGNRFGLVLQPGARNAQPTLGEGNVFEDNAERDRIIGGDLAVPDAATPIP